MSPLGTKPTFSNRRVKVRIPALMRLEIQNPRRPHPNLKVGEIVEKDDDTVTADVVAKDGSLVMRYMVDCHTGMMRPADMDDSMEKGEN
jgi:hypothetical protein